MRKSNWIILGILVVASIFFLWLWYYLQFNLIDNPLDLVLTIIWWAVIALACVLIRKAEQKRQERVRTTFVSANSLFNSEAGLVSKGSASPVEAIEQTLAGLEYNFHMEEFPSKDKVRFDYIVHSTKFDFEKNDDAEGAAATAAADAATGGAAVAAQGAAAVAAQGAAAATASKPAIQVKEWEGEVISVAHPDDDPQEFKSREELQRILEGAAAAA